MDDGQTESRDMLDDDMNGEAHIGNIFIVYCLYHIILVVPGWLQHLKGRVLKGFLSIYEYCYHHPSFMHKTHN